MPLAVQTFRLPDEIALITGQRRAQEFSKSFVFKPLPPHKPYKRPYLYLLYTKLLNLVSLTLQFSMDWTTNSLPELCLGKALP